MKQKYFPIEKIYRSNQSYVPIKNAFRFDGLRVVRDDFIAKF